MRPLNRLVAAALAAGALASAATAARAAAPPPAGDPAGIELARKVNAYYAATPRMGVEMRAVMPGGVMSMKMVLRRGRTQATLMTIAEGRHRITTAFTARGAFIREPRRRCWSAAVRGAARAAAPMIALRGARFLAPEPIGALARLEVVERDPSTRRALRTAYRVDPETGRMASMILEGLAFRVRTLPRAPRIPATRPVCKD